MKKSEINKTNNTDDDGMMLLLTETRLEEHRDRGDMMAERLENMARQITRRQLNAARAVELLRQQAENLHNQAREVH